VAWRGVAWRGVAWRGVAWRGVACATRRRLGRDSVVDRRKPSRGNDSGWAEVREVRPPLALGPEWGVARAEPLALGLEWVRRDLHSMMRSGHGRHRGAHGEVRGSAMAAGSTWTGYAGNASPMCATIGGLESASESDNGPISAMRQTGALTVSSKETATGTGARVG
jgi:hypothetical protein